MFSFFKKKSWIPKTLPILREEDYHTHFLGSTNDGKLFFGYETFAFPNGMISDNWQNERVEYVALYLFDKNGTHLETKHKLVGQTASLKGDESIQILEELIAELGHVNYHNISVKPFNTTIDGIEFGLIPNEESQMIELQPSSTIAFSAPWNGEYDT